MKSAYEEVQIKNEDKHEQKIVLALDKQETWFKEIMMINCNIAEGMGILKQLVQIMKESATEPNNKVGMSTGQLAQFPAQ